MALAALKAYFKGRNFRNFPKFWTFSLKFITSNTLGIIEKRVKTNRGRGSAGPSMCVRLLFSKKLIFSK